MLFLQRKYQKAKDTVNEAMRCPNAIGNPLFTFRLGQANYELKEIDRAKDELAYRHGLMRGLWVGATPCRMD